MDVILKYVLFYYHTDRLGSGSAVTDGSGEAVHLLGYMPYGETLLDLSHTHYETPYQFTGYEKDQETGLHYAEARYYDSRLSIFNSTDPMWYKYPHLSPYTYCSNNPINRIDPDGRDDYKVNENGYMQNITKLKDKILKFFIGTKNSDRLISADGRNILNMPAGTIKELKDNNKKTSFMVDNHLIASQIYEWLAANTKVEVSNVDAKKGKQEISVISNTHCENQCDPSSDINFLIKQGATSIDRITHSHLGNSGESVYPSGYMKGHLYDSDKRSAESFQKLFPNIIQRVFHVQTKAYIYYDKDKIYKIDWNKKTTK